MLNYYNLEFILSTYNASEETIKSSLSEFSQGLEVWAAPENNIGKAKDFKIRLRTQDPTVIFDICSQFGRIKSMKVNETQ